MEENNEERQVFDIREDDKVLFSKSYYSSGSQKIGEEIVLADTRVLTGLGKILLKPFSKKLDGKIRVYLGSIAKAIYLDYYDNISESESDFVDERLENKILEQINVSLIHELIHREAKIYHSHDGLMSKIEDIENAKKIMDYYYFVNLNRKEIATYGSVLPKKPGNDGEKPGPQEYLFAQLMEHDSTFENYNVYRKELGYLYTALKKYKLSDYCSDFSDADSRVVLNNKTSLGIACDSYMSGEKLGATLNIIISKIPWTNKKTRENGEFNRFIRKAIGSSYSE